MPDFKFPKIGGVDIRGLVVISMVGITIYILHLTAEHPELATNKLFEDIVKQLVGVGGFGLILMFLFGGSKASNAAADTVNEMARQSSPTPPTQPSKTEQMTVDATKVTVNEENK